MRLITRTTLKQYVASGHKTAVTLEGWATVIENNQIANFVALRRHIPSADQVEVKSGRTVTVFNIKSHRLITAIHYNRQIVYLLGFLSHTEYDLATWKKTL